MNFLIARRTQVVFIYKQKTLKVLLLYPGCYLYLLGKDEAMDGDYTIGIK
ncbi:hypothetical protein V6B05_10095 [Lactococcus garvieae]|nr:hypothetical protein [Lactococcus garvieae]MCI3861264.1 hypothetical protein [Lactococcus garvieae]